MTKVRPLKDRFEEKIYYAIDGCWYWTGYLTKNGYGSFSVSAATSAQAHRVSYQIYKGDLKGLFACHTCDNRSCVNPDHLYAGTQSNNMRDMHSRKRHNTPKGEIHSKSKLTDDQVRFILNAKGKFTARAMGNKFNVNKSTILRIQHRKTWKHIHP